MFESRIETNKTGEEKTMLRKNQKYVLLVTVLFTIASLVAACGTAATPAPATQPPATQPPAATEPAATQPAATQPAAAGPFTIGISNPFISSEYRTSRIVAMSFCEPRSWTRVLSS